MHNLATEGEQHRLAQWRAQHGAAPYSFMVQDQLQRAGLADILVSCEIGEQPGAAVLEYVVGFTNTGAEDTPIISDILALDTLFALPRAAGCTVHWSRGSLCRIDDFEPQCAALNPTPEGPQEAWRGEGNPLVLESLGGRSSCGTLPFFNLVTGEGWGIIVAIGWTGDWRARFWRDEHGVRVQAGMKRTHLTLHPGESIRSPRILLLFWEGDRQRGQNLLRRHLLAHHNPPHRCGDAAAPISLAVWGENRADRQLGKIAWLRDSDIAVDNFWIDAGWHGDAPYQDNSNVFNSVWGREVGNWWPNPVTYPDGLQPIGEAARAAGQRFTLWFEPERVHSESRWAKEHPDWLLGPRGTNYLLDLGRAEVREALTEQISALIADGGITCYRQDFNTDPAPFWEANDTPDRVGMTEIRHIEGLYAFWDTLLERHPGLLIDNCSSGGRRIDLETIGRSIPLWRSDFQCFPDFDPAGLQCQTYGLSQWVPLSSGCCARQDDYALLSTLGAGLVFFTPPNPSGDPEGYLTPWQAFGADWLQRATALAARLRPYFLGDYYPLLSLSLAGDALAAWQFDRPDESDGLVQVFRRQESPCTQLALRLRALAAAAMYEVEDLLSGEVRACRGAELMEEGLSVAFSTRPEAVVMVYRRQIGRAGG